jgi:peptidoglycan hydrolase-like protein with peptidoglycan-binding domain
VTLTLNLLLIIPSNSSGTTKTDKRKGRSIARLSDRASGRPLTHMEMKAAGDRLAEMGYGRGRVDGVTDDITRNALVSFQKWEGRKVTGRMSREDFDAIMSASAPQPKESGYKHVEVDLDRQVLLLTDSDGVVQRVLPISTGSGKRYNEKGIRDLAYTPRGRFRVYNKLSGWKRSPLGLLYYPNYFSGGLAIHGNPSVPYEPQSHGCIRIPMSAAAEMSRLLPVGTIVLIYDTQSFVSAKAWAEADAQKQEAKTR